MVFRWLGSSLVVVVVSLCLSISTRASGPHVQHMGFFWLVSHNPANVYAPFNYIPNAASIGADTAVLGSDANLADEALKNSIVATGTKLILTVGFNCTSLASAVDFANQLDAIHSAVTSGTTC